ncbi:hypothetical protein ACWGN5_26700 [Streptomyces sp. NPDC055815]
MSELTVVGCDDHAAAGKACCTMTHALQRDRVVGVNGFAVVSVDALVGPAPTTGASSRPCR